MSRDSSRNGSQDNGALWTADLSSRAVVNVSLDPGTWSYFGDHQTKLTRSFRPERWLAEADGPDRDDPGFGKLVGPLVAVVVAADSDHGSDGLKLVNDLPAANIAGTGSAPTPGAASAGTGTGAGGYGTGTGGGGTAGFTPVRKLTKIPDREYRRFASTGSSSGSVAISIRVNPDGSVSNCRIVRSSGNPYADSLMCQLTDQYVRFNSPHHAQRRRKGPCRHRSA